MNHSTVAKGAFLVACAILLIGVAWIALHGSGPSPGINQLSIAGSYMVTEGQPGDSNYCVINEVRGKQDEYTITLSKDLGGAGEPLIIKKNDGGEMVSKASDGSLTEVISGDNGKLALIMATQVLTLVRTVRMDRLERYTFLSNIVSVELNQKTDEKFTPIVNIFLNATTATGATRPLRIMTGQLKREKNLLGFAGELTALKEMGSPTDCTYNYKLHYLGDKILFKMSSSSAGTCEGTADILPLFDRFRILEYTKSNEPNE